MDPAYHEVIRRRLELPLHEGPDRTATLADAVRRHVEAGDTLYVAAAHGRPNAAVREIARQWWGRAPGFTLASVGVGSPWTALIHGGLVRRTITTFMGEGYPFPTPQALISRAVLDGRLEVQNWSMLTFPLRLLAGAMGVPYAAVAIKQGPPPPPPLFPVGRGPTITETLFEAPPPGGGLNTVTKTPRGVAMSAAKISAVS